MRRAQAVACSRKKPMKPPRTRSTTKPYSQDSLGVTSCPLWFTALDPVYPEPSRTFFCTLFCTSGYLLLAQNLLQ